MNIDSPQPIPVPGFTGVVAIGARGSTTVALKADGTVWNWGANDFGQLGVGDMVNRNMPVQVTGLTGVTTIGGGRSHNLAVKADGTVWGWGSNDFGQLGDGTYASRSLPVRVVGLNGLTFLAGQSPSAEHSLAVANPTLPARLTTAVSPAGAGTIAPPTGTYAPGTNVPVTATPNPGYVFTGFSGALTGTTNPQTLAVYFDTAVVANFAPAQPALTASVGQRLDTVDPGKRVVVITLLNSGTGAATNATITSITNIFTLTGAGTVGIYGGTPANLGAIVPGSSASANIGFDWPASALRARFTVNFTADGGYSGSTTVTTFR